MTKTETVIGRPRSFMALSGHRWTRRAQAQRQRSAFCCAVRAAPGHRAPGVKPLIGNTTRMLGRQITLEDLVRSEETQRSDLPQGRSLHHVALARDLARFLGPAGKQKIGRQQAM